MTISGVSRPSGAGIAGWVAANGRPAVNADPSLDLGLSVTKGSQPLGSCVALPLVDGENLVAILALYGASVSAFSADHVRLLELLAPHLAASLARATAEDETLHGTSTLPALKLVRGA